MVDHPTLRPDGGPAIDAGERASPNILFAMRISSDTGDGEFEWPVFDELSASSLFYTSGTTGNPRACSIRTVPTCCIASRISGGLFAWDSPRWIRSCR